MPTQKAIPNPENYIDRITIDLEGYRINVKGKLAANDQMISDYYLFDFAGNLIR